MNQQQKDAWLAALRSGRYQQGRGMLRSRSGILHCCLGVAAEVCGIESTSPGYIKQPPPEASWADFVFLPHEVQAHLADMNDAGKPFAEIADYIEQHVSPTE